MSSALLPPATPPPARRAMAQHSVTSVVLDSSSDRDDDDGGGGGGDGGGDGAGVAYAKDALRDVGFSYEVLIDIGGGGGGLFGAGVVQKSMTASALSLRQTVVPYDPRWPATCIYTRTSVKDVELERHGFVNDVMHVLLAASVHGRATRFSFDYEASNTLTLLVAGLGDTSYDNDNGDAIIEHIEPAFIVGHPWFTPEWRRRHGAIDKAWDVLRRAIEDARAAIGSAATTPISAKSGAADGDDDDDDDDEDLVVTVWKKLSAAPDDADGVGGDVENDRRHMEWLLTVLENSIVGFSVVYAPDADRKQALFTTSLSSNVAGDGPLSPASLDDARLFLGAISGLASDAYKNNERFERLKTVLRPVARAYAIYVNMARKIGNSCRDLAGVLAMANVESPIHERLRLETLYRQFKIFGPEGAHLLDGFGAVTPGSFGQPKKTSPDYRKQAHLEMTRSVRLCNCRLAFQSPGDTDHDLFCAERYWGAMPLPNVESVYNAYVAEKLFSGGGGVGGGGAQKPPKLSRDALYALIDDLLVMQCTEKHKNWELTKMWAERHRDLFVLMEPMFLEQLAAHIMWYHLDAAALRTAVDGGDGMRALPRTVRLGGMQTYELIQKLCAVDVGAQYTMRLRIDASIENPTTQLLLAGADDEYHYHNDVYCVYEAFDNTRRAPFPLVARMHSKFSWSPASSFGPPSPPPAAASPSGSPPAGVLPQPGESLPDNGGWTVVAGGAAVHAEHAAAAAPARPASKKRKPERLPPSGPPKDAAAGAAPRSE